MSKQNFLMGLLNLGGELEVLDDIEDMAETAAKVLSESDGIHNVRVLRDKKKGNVGLTFDFDNHRKLNRALYAVAGQKKTIFTPAVYKVNAHSFRKKNMTALIEMLLEEEKMDIVPSFINYTSEVNLPRPVRRISGNKSTQHRDGLTVRTTVNLADILENKTNTGIKIRY